MSLSSQIKRIEVLQQNTNDPVLRAKKIGTHTFRHSLGTHLYAHGMEIESVALILGHRTLDSTQIYIHLHNLNNSKRATIDGSV